MKMPLDSKDLTGFQSPGRIQNATNSAMKRWNTVIGKVRNGLPNRRVTSNMAAEIKDATSSCVIQQGASFKLRQQIESQVQLNSEPKSQQESPNHGESPKSDQTREQSHLNQKSDERKSRWFAMRSPLQGHIHNTLCPFWQVGDDETPRIECAEVRTFTLFDGNPFTRAGAQHQTSFKERDRLAEERRYAKGKVAESIEKKSSNSLKGS